MDLRNYGLHEERKMEGKRREDHTRVNCSTELLLEEKVTILDSNAIRGTTRRRRSYGGPDTCGIDALVGTEQAKPVMPVAREGGWACTKRPQFDGIEHQTNPIHPTRWRRRSDHHTTFR